MRKGVQDCGAQHLRLSIGGSLARTPERTRSLKRRRRENGERKGNRLVVERPFKANRSYNFSFRVETSDVKIAAPILMILANDAQVARL